MISPGKLNVIEGAYSMHPELSGYYDLSVFLDITPTLQEKRIRKRNLPDMAERFFKEWIPMEQHYFDVMKAKELREKSVEELNTELLNLLREQFNLRMQAASGQLQQTHLLKQVRRDVARVKTLLTQKAGA